MKKKRQKPIPMATTAATTPLKMMAPLETDDELFELAFELDWDEVGDGDELVLLLSLLRGVEVVVEDDEVAEGSEETNVKESKLNWDC